MLSLVKSPVEAKVTAATSATGVSSALGLVALYLLDKIGFVASMPDAVKSALALLVLAALTSASAFAAGYKAKHTPRPDLVQKGFGVSGVTINPTTNSNISKPARVPRVARVDRKDHAKDK